MEHSSCYLNPVLDHNVQFSVVPYFKPHSFVARDVSHLSLFRETFLYARSNKRWLYSQAKDQAQTFEEGLQIKQST